MKSLFTYIILVVLGVCSSCSDGPIVNTNLEGKELPSFDLLLLDSTTKLNTKSIPTGQPIVLFYFTPFCHFCRAQTEEIIAHVKSYPKIRFYFLTSYPLDQIKQYYSHYSIEKYPNITVAQDYNSFFESYFKAYRVPYLAIYSKEGKLKHALSGKVSNILIREIAFD